MPTKRFLLILVGVVLGAGALVFASVNRQVVDVHLYIVGPIRLPLWSIILVSLAVGWLVPRLLAIGRWFRGVRERAQLRRRVSELEAELLELRNLPFKLDEAPPTAQPPIQRPPPIRLEAQVVHTESAGSEHPVPLLPPPAEEVTPDVEDLEIQIVKES